MSSEDSRLRQQPCQPVCFISLRTFRNFSSRRMAALRLLFILVQVLVSKAGNSAQSDSACQRLVCCRIMS